MREHSSGLSWRSTQEPHGGTIVSVQTFQSVRYVPTALQKGAVHQAGFDDRSPFVRDNGRMRPGNQNNKQRMRGRGGRKGPSPLSRNYESNGPDVKIRGTALHVAEKYQQLARDAHASGDRVMSENYYQHAEHYLRIIAAAQGPLQQSLAVSRDDDGDDEMDFQEERREERRDDRRDHREEATSRGFMPLDAPQPFVDHNPAVNTKAGDGVRNGAGPAANAPHGAGDYGRDDDEDGEDSGQRRRMRGTRGRGGRRGRPEIYGDAPRHGGGVTHAHAPSAEAPVREQAPARPETVRSETPPAAKSEPGETAAVTAGEGDASDEVKKPRARRTARPRTAKKSDTDSETPAATDA